MVDDVCKSEHTSCIRSCFASGGGANYQWPILNSVMVEIRALTSRWWMTLCTRSLVAAFLAAKD
jgi:hypothetical protein